MTHYVMHAAFSRHARRKIAELLLAGFSLFIICNCLQLTLDGQLLPIQHETASHQQIKQPHQETNASADAQLLQVRRWLSTRTVVCHSLSHVGNDGDRVCDDAAWSPRAPCLVYSFGDGTLTALAFDAAMAMRGCRARSFDARLTPAQPGVAARMRRVGVHMYTARLAAGSDPRKGGGGERVTLNDAWHRYDPAATQLDYLRVRPPHLADPGQLDGQLVLMMLAQQLRGGDGSALVLDRVRQMSLLVAVPHSRDLTPQVRHSAAQLAEMLRVETLNVAASSLHQLGFRVAHSRLLPPAHSVPRPTTGQPTRRDMQMYHILLVRSGRDVWDRLQRHAPMQHDYAPMLTGHKSPG